MDNGVNVSLYDIYVMQQSQGKDLASIKSKVDLLPDHERRIRWLEKAVWASGGIGTAIGAAIVTFATKAMGGI